MMGWSDHDQAYSWSHVIAVYSRRSDRDQMLIEASPTSCPFICLLHFFLTYALSWELFISPCPRYLPFLGNPLCWVASTLFRTVCHYFAFNMYNLHLPFSVDKLDGWTSSNSVWALHFFSFVVNSSCICTFHYWQTKVRWNFLLHFHLLRLTAIYFWHNDTFQVLTKTISSEVLTLNFNHAHPTLVFVPAEFHPSKGKVKGVYALNKTSPITTGRHLPHGIAQCYLPPDTSECALF